MISPWPILVDTKKAQKPTDQKLKGQKFPSSTEKSYSAKPTVIE